jgi:hypothetical protein
MPECAAGVRDQVVTSGLLPTVSAQHSPILLVGQLTDVLNTCSHLFEPLNFKLLLTDSQGKQTRSSSGRVPELEHQYIAPSPRSVFPHEYES